MRLFAATASPYVRKVMITAHVKGLLPKIDVVIARASNESEAALQAANPLDKIPALILDDGTALHDSHVICEYLDAQVASPVLFPGEGMKRWKTLTMGSVADGILDASLLLVYEKRYRPEEKWHAPWTDKQWGKINAALDVFEAAPPTWTDHPDYGHITLACALGYLDFRQDGTWRAKRPNMVAWLEKFSDTVPAYAKTMPE